MMKLQAYGVTDNEILTFHEFMNRARLDSAVKMSHGSIDSSAIYFDNRNLANNVSCLKSNPSLLIWPIHPNPKSSSLSQIKSHEYQDLNQYHWQT